MTIDVDSLSSGEIDVLGKTADDGRNGGTSFSYSTSSAGVKAAVVQMTGAVASIAIRADTSGTTAAINSVSLQKIPGLHAVQTALDERPTKRGDPVHLEDDGVNDSLSWDAPADDYTIVRVNSSGTVTIQTSQALSGATDIMVETTIAGYVAVNRALTAGETSALTAYLEALAA